MMKLIATQEFFYNFKTLKVGDEFEAQELHGKMFIESKRARLKAVLFEAVMKNEEAKVDVPHNPRARYKNRMMRAEQ